MKPSWAVTKLTEAYGDRPSSAYRSLDPARRDATYRMPPELARQKSRMVSRYLSFHSTHGDARDRAVPDALGVLGEAVTGLHDAFGSVVEEADVDAPGLRGVDREVRGLLSPGGAQRVVLARPCRRGVVVVHPAIVPKSAAYVPSTCH